MRRQLIPSQTPLARGRSSFIAIIRDAPSFTIIYSIIIMMGLYEHLSHVLDYSYSFCDQIYATIIYNDSCFSRVYFHKRMCAFIAVKKLAEN